MTEFGHLGQALRDNALFLLLAFVALWVWARIYKDR